MVNSLIYWVAIAKKRSSGLKSPIIWLLRAIFTTRSRQKTINSGFILPTVVLVSLVVLLLTTAILFRAFDSSRNASYVRVHQILLNAAMPAIGRAKAKLEQLLNDPGLPRATPSDQALYSILKNVATNTINPAYIFGDETPLELAFDINGDGQLENGYDATGTIYTIENDESLNTAWKFPVDTDNNGKFDTFTLYAIYFRSPSRATSGSPSGEFNRIRNGLEARTPPMNQNQTGTCTSAMVTSADLVGDSSWYMLAGNLAKSFYVYTVNLPINDLTGLAPANYETKSSTVFSALEYEQDRLRVPINYQAIWFKHDLEITPNSDFYINGGIHTDSNLLAGGQNSTIVTFRQVSSIYSCYYSQDNAKITVGGNFGTNNVAYSTANNVVNVDLYQGVQQNTLPSTMGNGGTSNGVSSTQSTTSPGGSAVGYNDAAYQNRIDLMTNTALSLCQKCGSETTVATLIADIQNTTQYPTNLIGSSVSTIQTALQNHSLAAGDVSDAMNILIHQIQLYFSDRTRRVTFAEVSPNNTATQALNPYTSSTVFNSTPIDVPVEWRNLTNSATGANYTGLTLNNNQLPATDPRQLAIDDEENYLGDRLATGNNLPAYWRDTTRNGSPYMTGRATQPVDTTTTWTKAYASDPNAIRTRSTQIPTQLDLDITNRGQFWEQSAATNPSTTNLANVGGMRLVTGAGIYVDDDGSKGTVFSRQTYSFLPTPILDPLIGGSSATLGFVCSSTVTNCPLTTSGTNTGQTPYPSTFANSGTSQANILVWSDTMPMTSPISTETRSGDLLMRATAVYHYINNAGLDQTPIACISSYYDPTNSTTAKNQSSLPWNNAPGGKSNNGIVYSFPGRSFNSSTTAALARQASLIFSNGTVANQPLRTAMEKYTTDKGFTNFSYADYSAVDTALCSLGILNVSGLGVTATINTNYIAHGKIHESSFLDAREVKALQHLADYQNTAKQGDYGLTLEQRQPLEIRVTDIDVNYLAQTQITNNLSGVSDYLLPYSGIIYATRDDAIADNSYTTINTSNNMSNSSPTDFKLDPTRRPNAIRLINSNGNSGVTLARSSSASITYNQYNGTEKGLILVTNVPAYIKGTFNLHRVNGSTTQISEFTDTQSIASSSWYTQKSPNSNFACRPGRSGCPGTGGDLWRPATIISDAITILSDSFTDGFRSDGDFDLNRNYLSIPPANSSADLITYPNGLINHLVTNANWVNLSSPTYAPTNINSSYFANGVTPIQRRASFHEYLMEYCNNIVLNCDNNNPSNWTVDGTNYASSLINQNITTNPPPSGTTANTPTNLGFVRRVAFQRYLSNTTDASGTHLTGDLYLVNANNTPTSAVSGGLPVPLGVNTVNGTRTVFAAFYGIGIANLPTIQPGALWFKTTTSSSVPTGSGAYAANNYLFLVAVPSNLQSQPQLAPITQIFDPDGLPGSSSSLAQGAEQPGIQQNWLQQASTSSANTFNMSIAAGNSPSRPVEVSAGLQNLVRFLENWTGGNGNTNSNSVLTNTISGSFIQFKHSSYATAPYAPIITATATSGCPNGYLSIFGLTFCSYYTSNSSGTITYDQPPNRAWSFDVGLLSQLPDLFAQKFTFPSSAPPSEYFRELNSDDGWLKTLLCAKQPATGTTKPFINPAVPAIFRSIACPFAQYP